MRFYGFAATMMALALTPLAVEPLAAQDLPRATVTQAIKIEFIGQVAITGSLIAREELLVNPHIGGQQIVALNADIGDSVKKGQLLAELDPETLKVQLAQAMAEKQRAEAAVLQAKAQVALSRASLDSAHTNFKRDHTLLQSGTITQTRFDQTDTAYKSAQASQTVAQQGLAVAIAAAKQAATRVQLAELNLSYTRITAAAGGVISSRNATVGAIASPGSTPLFRIIRDNLIEVRTEVIETDIARIHPDDKATLRIVGLGETVGTVRLISPRVDPRTRLGEVRIALPENPALRIGSFVNGWILSEKFKSVGAPASAILSDAQGDYAQVVDKNGVVHKRRLETGIVWNGMREVRSGLNEGDTVILVAGAFFREGDKIIPVPATEATR